MYASSGKKQRQKLIFVRPAPALVGLLPVAVSAAHLALSDLVLYLGYAVPMPGGVRYGEMLVVTYVVKLKHDDVRFPAIHTGVGLEVVVYIRTNTALGYLTVHFCLGNNPFTMLRVVPAARFPLLLAVFERHGWGIYHGSDRLMKGKGVAQIEENTTPPVPQCRTVMRGGYHAGVVCQGTIDGGCFCVRAKRMVVGRKNRGWGVVVSNPYGGCFCGRVV